MKENLDQSIAKEQERQKLERKIKDIILPIVMEVFEKDERFKGLYENALDINQVAYGLSVDIGDSWEEKVNSVLDAYFRHANKDAMEKLEKLKPLIIEKLEEELKKD